MPRAPKAPPKTEPPKTTDRRGRTPGSEKTQFKKGRARTGGRQPRANVWDMLEEAAKIANARAAKDPDNGEAANLTSELLVANLIDSVRRLDPATAMRVLVPTIYPKATVKPVNIEIDTSPDGLADSLERVAKAMASGGDVTALTAVFNTLKAVQDARAVALEMRALERELGE